MATEKLIAYSEVKKKLTAIRQYFSGYPSTDQDKLARSVAKLCMEEVGKIKPVDAVEVVRCLACEHWHKETGWCDKHSHFVDRLGDFCYPEESGDWKEFDADYFCKDGERRTDNA